MRFVFKARNKKGNVQEGIIESVNKEMAFNLLEEKGLTPVFIEEEKKPFEFVKGLQKSIEGVTQKDLMLFFRQLHTLVGARVPIVPSLKALIDQTSNKYLRTIIREVIDDVEDGASFSDSIAKYPDVFPPLIYSIIKAGEISGGLQESVKFVADNIEKNYRLTSKIKGALFYPAFVIASSIVMGFVAMVVVLPRLTQVIEDMDVVIPWYTKAIIWLGDFTSSYWWVILIVIVFIVASLVYYIKTEEGRREWDRIKIKIPIIGKLYQYIYIVRFASNLSMLLGGGIQVVKSLNIVADIVNNTVYRALILKSADEVKSGGSISGVFSESPQFPSVVSKMIKIGEENGKTVESLDAIERFYEGEVNDLVSNITSLIEPILIVILGAGVAILVFAILLPIYNVVGQF